MVFSFKNFFNMDEEYLEDEPEYINSMETINNQSTKTPRQNNNNVLSMAEHRSEPKVNNSKISLFEPKKYADVKEVANRLLSGQATIVNFSAIEDSQAKRIVDFLTGTVYAIDGEIERIGDAIFLVTPHNYEISGSVSASISKD
ncbi:cell division protein SepF [Periweissella beninensis]|uniref:cell division protein SepF n=1 Tax=Periweissella beninensis TaxID=504936 RepID=UPI0021A78CA9|nr:cell division protein SepF [Periweissella beninensis]MCT4396620.1 DUF552 domain-containing protein [Periweissella beninensis]